MKNDYTHVTAIFQENGTHLISSGQYESAKIQVQNSFNVGGKEVVKVLEQSKTIKQPEFNSATKSTTMGLSFVEMALEKPKPPKGKLHWWLKTDEGKMAQKWATYSDKEKVRLRLEHLAHDQGETLLSFEIL
jgi:hypothetical protein